LGFIALKTSENHLNGFQRQGSNDPKLNLRRMRNV
jgi:hypothetical protein